jgi:dephospho-CoA kinase
VTSARDRWVLSGGLASGKSQIRKLLEQHGVVTIDADSVGHSVIGPDGPAFAAVADRWSEVVRDGEIDRKALAQIVFADREQLAALESITHPHIFDTISSQVEGLVSPVVVEIPLLHHELGEEWGRMVVDCRDNIRLERARGRGMSPADARARLDSQPPRASWLAVADLIVPNHGTIGDLKSTVTRLVEACDLTPDHAR